MFSAVRLAYLYPESTMKAALDHKEEWGCSFVCPNKNKLDEDAVKKDVGL